MVDKLQRYNGISPPWWVIAFIAMFVIGMVLVSNKAYPHMEDSAGCLSIPHPASHMKVAEGLSGDERDYIIQYDTRGYGQVDMEEHYVLAPRSEWKGGKPAYFTPRMSVWLDNNQDEGFDDWFIDARRKGQCKDYVHMKYDKKCDCWRVWMTNYDEAQMRG